MVRNIIIVLCAVFAAVGAYTVFISRNLQDEFIGSMVLAGSAFVFVIIASKPKHEA